MVVTLTYRCHSHLPLSLSLTVTTTATATAATTTTGIKTAERVFPRRFHLQVERASSALGGNEALGSGLRLKVSRDHPHMRWHLHRWNVIELSPCPRENGLSKAVHIDIDSVFTMIQVHVKENRSVLYRYADRSGFMERRAGPLS
jgi:hypothetical protein